MDVALIRRLAHVQFQLFTAQISHAYLTSLTQPPTPSRNQSNTAINSLSDLKTLQSELDALVSHCEEATQLLAKQNVMDKVSDTIMRERINHIEKELDGVERIEETMEGMIGRLEVARESLELELSTVDACAQVLYQLAVNIPQDANSRTRRIGIPKTSKWLDVKETIILQNTLGIRSPKDIQKILQKGAKLDKELYETGLEALRSAMDETYVPR